MNVDCFAFHADCFAFHAETGQMTADGWPSRYIDAELRGPDPGWIETLFYHRRTLMVENAFLEPQCGRSIGRFTAVPVVLVRLMKRPV